MERAGTLTSSGDAPDMDAIIRVVIYTALTNGIEVYEIRYGYAGLVADDIFRMTPETIADKINRGDIFLYSARFPKSEGEEVQLEGIEQLRRHGISALTVIDGDGSYHDALKLIRHDYNAVGLPGSIDNGVPYTDFTAGFDAACSIVVEAIDKTRDTATNHQRVFVVDVVDRDCGDIVMRAGVATDANVIVIPEEPYDIKETAENLKQGSANGKKHGIVVLVESVTGASKFKGELLRHGGFNTRANTLDHMQCGGGPTTRDHVLAGEMGTYVVKLLPEGKGGLAVGIENNKLSRHDILGLFDAKYHGSYALHSLNKDLAK